jgi:hypothetical protein
MWGRRLCSSAVAAAGSAGLGASAGLPPVPALSRSTISRPPFAAAVRSGVHPRILCTIRLTQAVISVVSDDPGARRRSGGIGNGAKTHRRARHAMEPSGFTLYPVSSGNSASRGVARAHFRSVGAGRGTHSPQKRILSHATQTAGILASAPHISCAGCRTRNTTKCDIEKFTTKPARMAAPFAASTGMNFAAMTRTVVLTSAPSTPDVTNVP